MVAVKPLAKRKLYILEHNTALSRLQWMPRTVITTEYNQLVAKLWHAQHDPTQQWFDHTYHDRFKSEIRPR